MTPEEMDRAIAEHVGARLFTEDGGAFWHFLTSDGRCFGRPTEDLNAMREAEQSMFSRHHETKDIFIDRLCRIMDPVNGYRKQSATDIIDATAEQHARAFVETIRIISIRQENIEREMRDTIKETVRE